MTAARPYRVVVADDVAHLRTLLRLVLERSRRFEVVAEAGNGRQAIEAAQQHRPDLTLLDLSMPVLDGLEALPVIRASVPSTTVVVLSGFDADRMEGRALEAGAAAYLVKGILPDVLVAQLLELLAARESVAEAAPPYLDSASVELPQAPDSAGKARTFVRQTLEQWRRNAVIDDALLLSTELVTNAVVHAHSAVNLRVLVFPERVRVEVSDTGGGALQLRAPGADALNGRGLLLVEELSRTWGTSADRDEKVVWFEL